MDPSDAPGRGSGAVIETTGLSKSFRGFRAVDGVDLAVAEGDVHALVGPNGAGKTTLFNLLTGFLKPTAGRIEARRAGHHRLAAGADRAARRGPLVPDHQPVPAADAAASTSSWRCRVRRARLAVLARPTGCWRRFADRAGELLDEVGLAEQRDVPAGTLAYGRKRALELALALALDPRCCCSTSRPPAWAWRTSTARSRSSSGSARTARSCWSSTT